MSTRTPPSSSSPVIRKLRSITRSIYGVAFDSFPVLQRIIDTLSTESALNSKNTTLTDDISWAKDSLHNDADQLFKIQQHIQFINAEETITSKKEILGVFNELTDFLDLILLDDLLTTLKGVSGTLSPDAHDYTVLQINGTPLSEIVKLLSKFKISLRLVAKPLKDVDFTKYDYEEEFLRLEDINRIGLTIDTRLADLQARLADLKDLFEHA